jgi:hypothetical protein
MTPQQYVETVIEKCLNVFPPDGDAHLDTFGELVFNGSMDVNMATILTHIIENPNCVYIVKADGTLKLVDA